MINMLSQSKRLITLDTVLGGDILLLDRMEGREAISQPFKLDLALLSHDGNVELKTVLGSEMTVRLKTSFLSERVFHGYVSVFQKLNSDGNICSYRAILSPFTAFLERRMNCRVFQNKTRKDIIQAIIGEYGAKARVEFDLVQDNPLLTMAVQYNESDWAFISRLAEELGWSYHFLHKVGQHTLVFTDYTPGCAAIPEPKKLEFNKVDGATEKDTISSWSGSRQLVSNKTAAASFDFKDPGRPVQTQKDTTHNLGQLPPMENYLHYGAYTYKGSSGGDLFSKLRMQEQETLAKVFFGQGNVRHMVPGNWFELEGHWEIDKDKPDDRKFLILAVDHYAENNYLTEGANTVYCNSFECMRLGVVFRPGRNTPKPFMRGPQTALVVGPEKEEIYCDDLGRICIQYHWDREGKFNDQSSCFVRVASQWAGSKFGFTSLPRIGTEVIVDFIEGDPDRPLITGAVYNASNMPPWELPNNKTQSGIYTNSTPKGTYENANALRFEDKKGSEEVWLHAEKDQRIEVENDESHDVGHDRKKTIKNDENVTVGNNRTEKVGVNEDITIGANRTEKVGANESITIGANRSKTVTGSETSTILQAKSETVALASTEQVGLARNLSVGAAYTIEVIGGMNTAVGLAQGEEVGLSKTTVVGKSYHIKAGDELTISVGKAQLVMKKDGTITLNGKSIDLGSTGDTTINAKGNLVQKGTKITGN